jgi:hypothetical protein
MDEDNYEYDLDQELLDFHIRCNQEFYGEWKSYRNKN